jgi:hypothetical protein
MRFFQIVGPIIAAALFFSNITEASEFSGADRTVHFTSPQHEPWTRWVLTEREEDKTLLLVVEAPDAALAATSQHLVFRKRFSDSQLAELENIRAGYLNLRDLPTRRPSEFLISRARTGHQPIWDLKSPSWTIADENDFARWVENEVPVNFLAGSGLLVDCADFAIAIRWIYAHDHGLPAANTISGSRLLIGQWTGTEEWDQLKTDTNWKKDERLLAVLKYVLENTYTHSIVDDLYPVKISREFVTPGSLDLLLYSQATGHTQVIKKIGPDKDFCGGSSCILSIWGNEPPAETVFLSQNYFMNVKHGDGGFMRWRWPTRSSSGVWRLAPEETLPGYSLEQYDHPSTEHHDFEMYIFNALGLESSIAEQLVNAGYAFNSQLWLRMNLTEMGHFVCYLEQCEIGSEFYENYSTPSKDRRLRETQATFSQLISQVSQDDFHVKQFIDQVKWNNSQYGDGRSTWDLLMNKGGWLDRLSSDPRQDYFSRWGLVSLSDSERFKILITIWEQVWYDRQRLVEDAQSACFPNSGSTASCDPQSPAIVRLATDRLDSAIRTFRIQFEELAKVVPETERLKGWERLKQGTSEYADCGGVKCTNYDFLASEAKYVERMSSRPEATRKERYGL